MIALQELHTFLFLFLFTSEKPRRDGKHPKERFTRLLEIDNGENPNYHGADARRALSAPARAFIIEDDDEPLSPPAAAAAAAAPRTIFPGRP